MTTWGDDPHQPKPVTYVTEVWCPPADDGRHQLRSHPRPPQNAPETEAWPEPEADT